MPPKETIIVGDHEKEIIDFLDRLRSNQELLVHVGTESFVLKIARATVSQKGRDILTSGGPIVDE